MSKLHPESATYVSFYFPIKARIIYRKIFFLVVKTYWMDYHECLLCCLYLNISTHSCKYAAVQHGL